LDSSVEQYRGALLRHAMETVAIRSTAGLAELRAGEPACAKSAGSTAARVPRLIDPCVEIISGCCGIGSEHIRATRSAVGSHR
jgi:methionine synthase I (cobalamin-dependent)